MLVVGLLHAPLVADFKHLTAQTTASGSYLACICSQEHPSPSIQVKEATWSSRSHP